MDYQRIYHRNLAAAYPPAAPSPGWVDPGHHRRGPGQPTHHERFRYPEVDIFTQGFAPPGLTTTDFTILRHEGRFHIFGTAAPEGNIPLWEGSHHYVYHASTPDFVTNWQMHRVALYNHPDHPWEAAHVWPPFVLPAPDHHPLGRFAMVYCGMDHDDCQSLGVAFSDNLEHWRRYERNPVINPGALPWIQKLPHGKARHCRDPHVQRVGETYLLYYTTLATDGYSAVGVAASDDLLRWHDLGPCLKRDATQANWLVESPLVFERRGKYHLIVLFGQPPVCYVSDDPTSFHDAKTIPVRGAVNGMAPEIVDASFENQYLAMAYAHGNGHRLSLSTFDFDDTPGNESITIHPITAPEQLARWPWTPRQ